LILVGNFRYKEREKIQKKSGCITPIDDI